MVHIGPLVCFIGWKSIQCHCGNSALSIHLATIATKYKPCNGEGSRDSYMAVFVSMTLCHLQPDQRTEHVAILGFYTLPYKVYTSKIMKER